MAFRKKGLLFREVEESDLSMLRDHRNDPDSWPGLRDPTPVVTMERQREWYASLGEDSWAFVVEVPEGTQMSWTQHGVEVTGLAVPPVNRVGLFRISNIEWERRCAGLTGCDVFKPHRGKGYGTRMMRGAIEWLIHDLGFHRLTANALDNYPAAQRIIEKAGMKQEGALRSYIYRDGAWRDFICYSILEGEL